MNSTTDFPASDDAACSQCAEWRQLADDTLNTLRITREKYGIGNRHVMMEKNREIEKLREALQFIATDKIANAADMRYRAARALEFCPANDERMHHYQRRRTSITGLVL